MAIILALESSCDDSAAALVTSDRQILAQAVVGQNEAHGPFGGVVPEIAARAHAEILPGLVRQVLREAELEAGEVDAIAATAGPGLIGGVMVGLMVGKASTDAAPISRSRTSARGSMAGMTSAPGRSLSTSFIE